MFFRVVQFPLTGYLAWAVVKAHSFFFSLLATAPFLAIAAVVGLVPPAFALVLLIGFWAAMLLSGRAGRMGERHAAKAGLLLAPFAFLLAALVVLFQRRMPTSLHSRGASAQRGHPGGNGAV